MKMCVGWLIIGLVGFIYSLLAGGAIAGAIHCWMSRRYFWFGVDLSCAIAVLTYMIISIWNFTKS